MKPEDKKEKVDEKEEKSKKDILAESNGLSDKCKILMG
jgi:hypothetical protein